MASSTCYRATLTGRATHTYTCAACGCAFRTGVEATVVDTGGWEDVARDRATRRLTRKLKGRTPVRPCPGCGLVPVSVIARRAQYWHVAVWLGVGVAAGAVGAMAALGRVPFGVASVTVPGLAVFGLVLHAVLAAANPNRRQAANRERGQADVAAGTTEILLAGRPDPGPAPRAWTARHTAGILLAAVAPLALLAPAYLGTTLDLAANPHLTPSVVVPGSNFIALFPPASFRSVNGWWTATPNVKVLNAEQVGTPKTLPAFTHATWGGGFHLTAEGTPQIPTDLHVGVTVPDDPTLDGKTLRLRATLKIVYPTHMTNKSVDKSVTTVTHEFPVTLANREANRTYTNALLAGVVACSAGTFAGGALLASGLRSLKR